jgi:di/tricarboxylate transporter
MTILSVFVISEALERSGVTRWIGQRLLHLAGSSERRLSMVLMLTSASLSTIMKPIASTATLLPTTMGIARQSGVRPSRLMMPLSFGALLGGTATLLTTANIIVSTTLEHADFQPYGLFDFLPIGIPLILAGTLTVVLLAPHFLPDRDVCEQVSRMQRLHDELAQSFGLPESCSEVIVLHSSRLKGEALHEGGLAAELGLGILGIWGNGQVLLAPDRNTKLQTGDILILDGKLHANQKRHYGLRDVDNDQLPTPFGTEEIPLIEATLIPHSELGGRSLRQIDFRQRFGLQVLAIWRQGTVLNGPIGDISLRFGDALLMQGPRENIEALDQDPNFLILEEATNARPPARAWLAIGILAISLGLGAAGVLPVAVATLAGATFMVLCGEITMNDAYQSIDWKTILFVAGMFPLSIAMQTTGLAQMTGNALIGFTASLGSLGTAAALLIATIGFSLFLGGQTAGMILAPIAIASSNAIGMDPRGMAMAVAIGCSLAFISPMGHPAHLLVMGPGGYTFRDYARLGAPLTIISILVTLAGLHWIWNI